CAMQPPKWLPWRRNLRMRQARICTLSGRMPDVEANRRQWDGDYAWPDAGDEWSAGWSGPDAQWHFTLMPRLRRFLPATAILEIGSGYGRWTSYLVGCCDRYVGVDLSAQSVAASRRRFADV